MMNHNLVYDIRTSEKALATLINFTGVKLPIWEMEMYKRNRFRYDEELVEDIIKRHGHFPVPYESWQFVYFHITTSANRCASFEKYGIMDLNNSYLCLDSELRMFLDKKGIYIDLKNCILRHNGKKFDVSYTPYSPRQGTLGYKCWSVGRKLYYDYTTCGFLSVWDRSPYGGDVHRRPEILSDIDDLLGLTLSQEWHISHKPFEIVAMVPGADIVYDQDDSRSSDEKVIDYLTRAYNTAFGAPRENVLLIKNHVHIPPHNILEINPLDYWQQT